MAREVPSVEKIEAAIKRATVLERVNPGELSEKEGGEMPEQFGDNFYLLFEARRIRDSHPRALIIKHLEKAEALGEVWQRFLIENNQLLAELDEILAEEDIYREILRLLRDISFTVSVNDADAFERRFHPTIGINVIGIPIWRRLNTLLKQAAEAMEKVGINPTQFYS